MKKNVYQNLKNPPKKYRPIPFWSWNEKLEPEETRRQISEMDQVGIGGYFMHARGGLQTEYMGKDWMENIAVGITEAKERTMGAWAYDENGWPSGFGDGKVNGRGEAFQQKYLRYEEVDTLPTQNGERDISCFPSGNGSFYRFFYEVNPFYVDTLDATVTETFLREIYEPYVQEFSADIGEAMPGFFTDEPQVSRKGIPWSFGLPEAYQTMFNEDLLPLLPQLFQEEGEYKQTRYRFWYLVQELFVTNYTEQIYRWCTKHNLQLTGHMVLEETLLSQVTSNGAVMPHYEFFHVPGMDWLGRHINPPTTPLQVSSVAHQMGHKQVISETFALTGWNVSFEELKWMFEWQLVRGVTLLCQHLEGYSLRGIRKRDYPPSLFYQQPWWNKYRVFNDAVSRIGMLLTEGTPDFEVLILHPQSSAWLHFNTSDHQTINWLHNQFVEVTTCLEQAHIPFHYGDERILKRHGSVKDDSFVVGCQTYKVVVVPPVETLADSTCQLLHEFAQAGGKLLWVGQQPTRINGTTDQALRTITSSGQHVTNTTDLLTALPLAMKNISITNTNGEEIAAVSVTRRQLPSDTDETASQFYFFVNSDIENTYASTISVPGSYVWSFISEDGSVSPLPSTQAKGSVRFTHTFPPRGSLAIFAATTNIFPDLEPNVSAPPTKLSPDLFAGPWNLTMSDPNALTLDYCDFWFDGHLQARNEHISVIQARAMALERPVTITMDFSVSVAHEYIPDEMYLVIECPSEYQIHVNGEAISTQDVGYYRDHTFRKLDMRGKLQPGTNTIRLETEFRQSEAIYEQLRRAHVFESERNKLTYDREIEAIYLVGNFGVITRGVFKPVPNNACSYQGSYSLGPTPVSVDPSNLTTAGLPFFSGTVVLAKTFILQENEIANRSFALTEKLATVVGLRVNGTTVTDWYWRPYEANLEGLLVPGQNTIELELTGNLRNLLGPHHLQEGESYAVRPGSFFKEPNIWGNQAWTDDYCFVNFGVVI